MKLSIVIPCFNTSSTIVQTIRSLHKELERNITFELIVVDDGSTDATGEIIVELQRQFDNIRIYSQENAGVSSARNTGLKLAKGEYIWYFDADDLLFDNVGKSVCELLKKYSPDILRFDSVTEDFTNCKFIQSWNNLADFQIKFNGKYKDFLKDNVLNFACWSVIVKRDLLVSESVLFDVNFSISEDVLWNFNLAKYALTNPNLYFVYTNLRVVRYIVRDESAVNTLNTGKNLHQLNSLLKYADALSDIRTNFYNTPLRVSINKYTNNVKRQLVTKLFSCNLPLKENKKFGIEVEKRISEDAIDLICKYFLLISAYPILIKVSQYAYRGIFLKYIKPKIGRN